MDLKKTIIKRYLDKPGYFYEFLVEEQKRAEKVDNLPHPEFFEECYKVTQEIKEDIEKQVLQKRQMLTRLLNEALDKKDNDLMEHATREFECLNGGAAKERFFVAFPGLSKNRGDIFLSDIRDIEDHIRWAKIAVHEEKLSNENSSPNITKSKKEDSPNSFDHIFSI